MLQTIEQLIREIHRPFSAVQVSPPAELSNETITAKLAGIGLGLHDAINSHNLAEVLTLLAPTEDASTAQALALSNMFSTIGEAIVARSDGLEAILPSKIAGYTPAEVTLIQRTISGEFKLSPEEVMAAKPVLLSSYPELRQFENFVPAYFQDVKVFDKVYWDPRVERWSIYAFFPEVIATGLENLQAEVVGRNRHAVKFSDDDNTFYIKTYQTPSEAEIARVASNIGVGPVQLPSLSGYITEQAAPGHTITSLPEALLKPARMFEIGKNFGEALQLLHGQGIAFNDALLVDDFSHSHLLIADDCAVKIIDYGNALKVDDRASPPDEFLINYARSRFELSMLVAIGDPRSHLEDIREALRPFADAGSQHFFDYDIQLVYEGLYFANARGVSGALLTDFRQGFESTGIVG